jgi:hypothetical protein
MVVGSSSVSQILKVLVPILIIIWSFTFFGFTKPSYDSVVRQFKNQKQVFVADFLNHEIDGQFSGQGIEKLCASKKWTQGLIFSCDPPAGGVSVIRNAQLHCIRLAIETGGKPAQNIELPFSWRVHIFAHHGHFCAWCCN